MSLLLFACGSGGGAAQGNPGYEVPADPQYLSSHPNPLASYAATGSNPGEIELHWQLPVDPAPAAVEIWRGRNSGQSLTIEADGTSDNGVRLLAADTKPELNGPYVAADLADGALYFFIIRLKYSDGRFSSGVVLQTRTLVFENPRDVTVTEIPGSGLRLDWQPAAGSGPAPDGYILYRSDAPFETTGTDGLTPFSSGAATVRSVTDTPPDMTPGLTWYYLLKYTWSDYAGHTGSGSPAGHTVTGCVIPPLR
jgi:hypothetical protein